jgi:hypothetical protein
MRKPVMGVYGERKQGSAQPETRMTVRALRLPGVSGRSAIYILNPSHPEIPSGS